MFGDEPILGKFNIHIDAKKRIFLPISTKREKGDKLLVIDECEYLSICRQDVFLKNMNALEKKCELLTDIRAKKEMQKEIIRIYSLVLKEVICDDQGRITLGSIANKLDSDTIGIGANKVLVLKK